MFFMLDTLRPGALFLRGSACPPGEAEALLDRFESVCTPRHSSWLNVVEVAFNVMIRQCRNCSIDCIETLRREVAA